MTKRALAGLAALGLALAGVAGCAASGGPAPRVITSATTLALADARVGDCVGSVPKSQAVALLAAVPCSQPHEAQVFCAPTLTATAPPSPDQLQFQVLTDCLPQFKTFFGGSYFAATDYKLNWFLPDEAGWTSGSRAVRVVVVRGDGVAISGDLKGTMTALPNVVGVPTDDQCTGPLTGTSWNADGVEIIDCAKPHYYEVYATLPVTTPPTTDDQIKAAMSEFCTSQYQTFTGAAYDKGGLTIRPFYPSVATWPSTPFRTITCLLGSDAGGITGSLKGSKK